MSDIGEITRLLERLDSEPGDGRDAVLQELMPLVYGELKVLARANRYRWSGVESLGTTSLVHEAYLKLADQDRSDFSNRRQFYALASKAMRSILIDNARWHGRQKRGGGRKPAVLEESMLVSAERSEELLALDEALSRSRGAGAAARPDRRVPLFRRADRGRDRPGARCVVGDGQARLEPGPNLALPRAKSAAV